MQRVLPLRMSSLFSRSLLTELALPRDIDFTDLVESDAFFDSLQKK